MPVFTNYDTLLSNYFALSERQKHKRQHEQDEPMQSMSVIKYKTSAIKRATPFSLLHSCKNSNSFIDLKLPVFYTEQLLEQHFKAFKAILERFYFILFCFIIFSSRALS